ncbi:MAG: hypothetical protein QXT67_01770 [Candidatus Bathyarchaeia archaeon]
MEKGFSRVYVKDLIYALDKHSPIIRSIEDVNRLFASCFPGERHLGLQLEIS